MDLRIRRALDYNRRAHKREATRIIQRITEATVDGIWGPQTVMKVMGWQKKHNLKVDGKVGPNTWILLTQSIERVARELSDQEIDDIIAHTIRIESAGHANPYAASNLDAEFEGWFDRPRRNEQGRSLHPRDRAKRPDHKPHWCSKYGDGPGTHIGRSEGAIQFTQHGGALGKVLERFCVMEPEAFREIFGDHWQELLKVTTSRRGTTKVRKGLGPGKRSLRVLPVGGIDLWKSYWEERFERAALHPVYQYAQRRVAAEDYFVPAVALCEAFGLHSQADLAVAFDACVQHGSGGSYEWWQGVHKSEGKEPTRGAIARFWRAKKKHGDDMTIHDVIDEFKGRIKDRRKKVFAHGDPWVIYTNLGNFELGDI